ncbi:MAG: hypothetical protein CM15mP114_02910 [Alphaproteobacteria bacterium]|nr:MAG: hypothetical protein CM15mP114_02910 [Alphaproteobacteria bacterium]
MDLKEEIKNSIKLSEVIGKNLSLKKRDNNNYVALCPFHKEKTPSFNISDDKGFYHCFGCGKNGDIFNYLMDTENLSFVEALKKLADHAGINTSKQNYFVDPKITNHFNLLKRVSESYINNLNAPLGEKARNYLQKRGFNETIIKNFNLGYSGNLKSNQHLVSTLLKEGFSIDDFIDVGLIKKNDDKDLVFFFQQRIMFPILNNSGKVIAFGGRILGDGQPKYLNSPETSLFLKSRQLFGIFNAKKLLHKKRFIICEGYTDVICLHSHGYPAVASLGTALTDDQIEKIFNIVDEAFLVFDGDIAGKNATERVFQKYLPKLKLKKKLKFVFLPDKLDPEEFIKNYGLEEFENLLDKALGVFEMLWSQGLKMIRKNEPESYAYSWNYLRTKVNTIENNNIKLAYRDEIEKRIRIFREKNKNTNFKKNISRPDIQKLFSTKKNMPKTGVEIKLGAIIYIMLIYPKICVIFNEKISLLNFRNSNLNNFKNSILNLVNKFPEISAKDLQQKMSNEGFTVQINNFMQSSYPTRLNIDPNQLNEENMCSIFEELLSLLDFRNI